MKKINKYIFVSTLIIIVLCLHNYNSNHPTSYINYLFYKTKQNKYLKENKINEFYLSTVDIKKPVIGRIGLNYYIFPDSLVNNYINSKSIFKESEEVFPYIWWAPGKKYFFNYQLYKWYHYTIEFDPHMIIDSISKIDDMILYKFRVQPLNLLYIIKQQSLDTTSYPNDDIMFDYSREYYPAIKASFTYESLDYLCKIVDSINNVIDKKSYPWVIE